MSRTETLLQVKEAEETAKRIVQEAEDKRKAAVSASRREAVKLIQDAESQIRAEVDSKISNERDKLQEQRNALLAEGTKEATRIEGLAEDRIRKVKDHLVDKFQRAIDATS